MIIAERFLLQHLYECAGIDLHKNMELINENSNNHNNMNDTPSQQQQQHKKIIVMK